MAKKDIQNRFKSKVFWVAILSAIAIILKAFGIYEIDDKVISTIVDSIFGLLVLFGIANNPSSKTSF